MASSPANSPCDPALGWSDTAAKPVISASHSSRSQKIRRYPSVCSAGANGCRFAISGQVTGSISEVAFSFMVQEPSGIIEVVSDRSFASRRRMYRSISVSVW